MVVYPLEYCLARPPDEEDRSYPLIEHLCAVGKAMGNPDGSKGERLCFLAGLLHDAGKACRPWQDYITAPPRNRPRGGVPHSFAGAMLFAVLLKELLDCWQLTSREKEVLLETGLSLIYFIYHHHGAIPDLMEEHPPWLGEYAFEDLLSCDLDGLISLVSNYFPELTPTKEILMGELENKLGAVNSSWKEWCNRALDQIAEILEQGNPFGEAAGICLFRNWINHRLIAGDRLHAAGVDPCQISGGVVEAEEAGAILDRISNFCNARREKFAEEGARDQLLTKREDCRQAALRGLLSHKDARLFTLELPTGYGKTLTALSTALTAIGEGLCQRIIYVAPYISILSQAAAEISDATGLETLMHHHLAALENLPGISNRRIEETAVDTWLAPVVATTYNQFFHAFFPRRGQHTMRLKGLQNSFVIIDEPQIIASTSWVPFLAMMEAAARELNCRLLFVTATLPETEGGLFTLKPVSLGREEPLFNRYRVESIGCLDESELALTAVREYREKGATAVILNTIQDAALLYECIQEMFTEDEKMNLHFLSGRLTPLHKRAQLRIIKKMMDKKQPALVISTQVLEAGVDLSFPVLFRALPLLPSVIQAAGRCNRHGEGATGSVYLFTFKRGGEIDTRRYVYRDPVQREVTDLILGEHTNFNENVSTDLIGKYYRECYRRNPHQAALRKIEAAAYGQWGELAGLEPFGPEIPTYGVFVPFVHWELPEIVQSGLNYFNLDDAESLWEHYIKPGFIGSLDFMDRRRFMTLVYQFMVALPLSVAVEVGEPIGNRTVLRLRYPSHYHKDTGLSLVPANEPVSEQFI